MYDESHGVVYYKCFNEGDCPAAGDGNAWHASRWLKHTDKGLYSEFVREAFRSKVNRIRGKVPLKVDKTMEVCSAMCKREEKTDVEKEFSTFIPIKNCPPELKEKVKNFCVSRCIPKERIKEFRVAVKGKYKNRIVIPAFNKEGRVVYFQCRTLGNETPKYLNSATSKEGVIYGIERVKKNIPVIVLEGPIDSMFVENGVATFGCGYPKEIQNELNKYSCLYLMDNDKAGNAKMRELLNSGYYVFDWSKFLRRNGITEKVKDINDYIKIKGQKGLSVEELKGYFTNSAFDMVRFTK